MKREKNKHSEIFFSVDLWSSFKLKIAPLQHGRERCHFERVCDVMNAASTCGRSVQGVTSQPFVLFSDKERTKMAAP